MSNLAEKSSPPDQAERQKALDAKRSIIVRAPAGSGKTTLLSERFLRLLTEVDEPGQVVAITFTEAAAAEMRNRVLDQLRNSVPGRLAQAALEHSRRLGWNLVDLPAQLRISTIDSFCRDLAMQRPLASGLGGGLKIAERPVELYRLAACRTIERIGSPDEDLSQAIEALLLWRDNSWTEIEELLAEMLENRERWMQGFVLDRAPDWETLRTSLERPLARAGGGASLHYTGREWQIVRACFKLLRHAAGELHVVFSDAGLVDFTQVAQIALGALRGENGQPADAALAVADRIRHLLVDEFQDTSRRQFELLTRLVGAWPDRGRRTCFLVGDPMQSIYGFRDADAELFSRVERLGLEIPGDQPLHLEPVQLRANFRSAPELVQRNNDAFARVFAKDDGSGVRFSPALPARDEPAQAGPRLAEPKQPRMQAHIAFIPRAPRGASIYAAKEKIKAEREAAREKQIREIVALVMEHLPAVARARAAKGKYRVAILGRTRNALAPIAKALREAAIAFRAVELEQLKERPEIVDALCLARALLNPQDRVAWLGVLRAPWCGLSLADLHLLVSADEIALQSRPVPDLLAERIHLLSDEGRAGAQRVVDAFAFAAQDRHSRPAASAGTWIERVWLRLGGAQCASAAARANLDLFWSSLDNLPQGEQDLLGPALDAALAGLKSRPDPAADGDCGVLLMTIHQAKGLEFEVVIVPELQASEKSDKREMLSWLERGLDPESGDEPGEVTEFLVAPLQTKGAGTGPAKALVDRARRERETQELRRLLYVAATRAREELHFFARPEYIVEKNGAIALADPKNSLLTTAWPAFEPEICQRFAAWSAAAGSLVIESPVDIAAAAEELDTSARIHPAMLRRLPLSFSIAPAVSSDVACAIEGSPLTGTARLYERHEGGLLSRSLGQTVHSSLHELAQLMAAMPRTSAIAALPAIAPRIAAQIRSAGVDAKRAMRIAQQAVEVALQSAADPVGEWILSTHIDAGSELRWTGIVDGSIRTVQVDRVFRADAAPLTEVPPGGAATWWIIDYKTAREPGLVAAAALPELRRIFAPQLEAYAAVLRNLQGADTPVCAGLYYPRMLLFDWWSI